MCFAVIECLLRDHAQRAIADAVVMEVSARFETKVGRRQHHAGLAVPVSDAVARGRGIEGAPRVVVVADNTRDVIARHQHVACGEQSYTAGGAAVLDRDERQRREPKSTDQVVRFGFAIRSTHGHIDVTPRDARVGKCTPHRFFGKVMVFALKASEHGSRRTDDVNVLAHGRARNP